jgi:hypothetical protein
VWIEIGIDFDPKKMVQRDAVTNRRRCSRQAVECIGRAHTSSLQSNHSCHAPPMYRAPKYRVPTT